MIGAGLREFLERERAFADAFRDPAPGSEGERLEREASGPEPADAIACADCDRLRPPAVERCACGSKVAIAFHALTPRGSARAVIVFVHRYPRTESEYETAVRRWAHRERRRRRALQS